MHLSLSIEDTNRIRQRLGLKLISLDGSDLRRDDLKARALAVNSRRLTNNAVISKDLELGHDIDTPSPSENSAKLRDDDSVGPDLQPTSSWLENIRSQALHIETSSRNSGHTSPEKKLSFPQFTSTRDQLKRPSNSHMQMETSLVSELSSQHSQRPPLKPHEAPLPSKGPKLAIFKPKKIKSKSIAKRTPNRMVAPLTEEEQLRRQREEESEFEKYMLLSRQRHERKVTSSDGPTVFVEEKPLNVVSFTRKIKDSTASLNKGTELPNRATTEFEARRVERNDSHDLVSESAMESETYAPASNNLGVVDVLRRLEYSAPAPKAETLSKEWAKKITKSQKMRDIEMSNLRQKYASLPVNERQEALRIHQQQILREQAAEARELAARYKPEIVLENCDANGNILDTRKAFKELSKAFHGPK